MWVERDDARPQPGSARRVDHSQVATVDAVEGADGRGAARPGQVGGVASDVHAPVPERAASTRSSTTDSGRSRAAVNDSGVTASATENGPTSVRRSVTQCPPSAIASDRT